MATSLNSNKTWLSPSVLEVLRAKRQQELANSATEYTDCENGFFVYDLDALSAHLNHLVDQDVVKLWFAVKANPLSKVLQTLDNQGFNFDVASTGELTQVQRQGVEGRRILNTGPAKSKKQLHHFIKAGVETFVVESINQLTWLNEVAQQYASFKPRVLLRVQLQWQEGEKNPLGGNSVTPFGLGVSEWQQVDITEFDAVDICGLHIFQWGNMLSNEKMYSLWSQMVPPLTSLANELGFELKILDLGGGLGIDYLEQGQTLTWSVILQDLAKIKSMAGVEELWLELGRFAVAECGYYVTPVVDKKVNFEQQQLVLGAGINHLLRPAITDQPFPVALVRESQQQQQDYDLHGPLCTSMDKLGTLPLPQDVAVDDQLVFGYSGAYGFTESMPFFLCHELAGEYVIEQGQLSCVRQNQPADVYLA